VPRTTSANELASGKKTVATPARGLVESTPSSLLSSRREPTTMNAHKLATAAVVATGLLSAPALARAHTWTPKQISSAYGNPPDPAHNIYVSWNTYTLMEWSTIGMNRYELHRSTTSDFTAMPGAPTRVMSFYSNYQGYWNNSGLSPCTTYYFVLVQVANDGHYVTSSQRAAMTSCPTPDAGMDAGRDTGPDTGADIVDTGVDTGADIADTGVDTGPDTAMPDASMAMDAAMEAAMPADAGSMSDAAMSDGAALDGSSEAGASDASGDAADGRGRGMGMGGMGMSGAMRGACSIAPGGRANRFALGMIAGVLALTWRRRRRS